MKGLLTLNTLKADTIQKIIDQAVRFKNGEKISYPGKTMATLFFENSTRTQYSFQMAMIKLGITPVSFNANASSLAKGESLYDTVKTFEALGVDGVIIRHSKDGYYRDLESVQIPVFNAGDGASDHPTQTLLDLMTIYEEFGRFDGLKICIVGDIKHSRVAHGNAEIMKRLGMCVSIAGPEIWLDDTAYKTTIDEAIADCDVINLLRVQFERHKDALAFDEAKYHALYGMTSDRAERMKEGAIIIHPAPINRGIEIADDVAECPKSRILKQMQNGVFVRMAVLSMVLEGRL